MRKINNILMKNMKNIYLIWKRKCLLIKSELITIILLPLIIRYISVAIITDLGFSFISHQHNLFLIGVIRNHQRIIRIISFSVKF